MTDDLVDSEKASRKVFRRYFPLILVLWILLVLYPNPANLVISIHRVLNFDANPGAVQSMLKDLPSDGADIEKAVLARIRYRHDWQVYGMPWYDEPIIAVNRQGMSDTRYFTGAAVAEIEALAKKAFGVVDPKERAEMQRQVGQMFYDGYYTVPLAGKATVFALSNRVKDWPIIPGFAYPQTHLQFVTLKR